MLLEFDPALDRAQTGLGNIVELQRRGGESLAELGPLIFNMLNQLSSLPQTLSQARLLLLVLVEVNHRFLEHNFLLWAALTFQALWLGSEISVHLFVFPFR